MLLLKVVDIDSGALFWLLPGGGREADETEENCVQREVREETALAVAVVRPLFEVPDHPGGIYNCLRTYLCHITSGEARPGIEPEVDTAAHRTIREVGRFDLRAHNVERAGTWRSDHYAAAAPAARCPGLYD